MERKKVVKTYKNNLKKNIFEFKKQKNKIIFIFASKWFWTGASIDFRGQFVVAVFLRRIISTLINITNSINIVVIAITITIAV